MLQIQFVSRSADGTSLILEDSDGNQFMLEVTDDVRSAVRLAYAVVPTESAPSAPASPGEIQALLRSGLSPHEVAEVTGSDLERVLRYFAPVEAEIQRAVSQAIAARVGTEPDAPLMGELVVDRLAARGVDTEALAWTAAKNEDNEWDVILSFPEGDAFHDARWALNAIAGAVTALDQTAAELTETVAPPTTVHALFPPAPHFETTSLPEIRQTPGQLKQQKEQEDLVDSLNKVRGVAQPVLEDIDGLDGVDVELTEIEIGEKSETPPSKPATSSTPAATGASASESSDKSATKKAGESSPALPTAPKLPERQTTEAPKRRRGRQSVPSWDEIVFGSRPDGS